MDLGCNVLVEKPMAITIEEADEMIEASKKNNVKLCVVHQHLFDPHIQRAKRLLETGVLGDIVYAEVKYYLDNKKMIEEQTNNPEHWVYKLPMSIYGEYTPHLTYLLLSFLNKIDSIQVLENKIDNGTHPATGGLAVQLSSENAIGRLLMFYSMDHEHFTIDIFGTKAVLHINMLDLTITLEKERNLPRVLARMFTTVEQSFRGILETIANIIRITFGKLKRRPGHRNLVKKFIESVQNDEAPPVTGEEGREVVRILKMIEEQLAVPKK
jgi:predicted dehydrogenase